MAVALTFCKVNGKPFVEIFVCILVFFLKANSLFGNNASWKKKDSDKEVPKSPTLSNIPRLTEGRLSDISWSLDVLDMGEKEKIVLYLWH